MLDKKKIPIHVAIIMDGNGRWSRKHGLPRSEGHRRGLRVVKETIKAAGEFGIRFLTLYAFSSENWKRPKEEVDFLMKMCETVITEELPYMIKNDIRLKHIGALEGLSVSLKNCISNAQRLTENNKKLCVQLAFNYGSRLEIVQAVKKIAREVKEGIIQLEDITEKRISDNLYTSGAPDPDLLIRTSGEMRISNFLLWQLCYTELYITKKMWPDFNKRELIHALEEYQKRNRRFGGVHD